MKGNKDIISCINSSTKYEITLGYHSRIKLKGKVVVPVPTKENQWKNIHDVYYVPHLKHNLISVCQLMEHDYNVIFQWENYYVDNKTSH